MTQTIDFGIDLGTTNSCIARASGGKIEILRNNEGFEVTPSAVWLDRKDRLHVGRRAREQYESDEENACLEFKLQMGRVTETVFQRSGQRLRPEEMSAEVLKSLLADARQQYGDVTAAVITVPADFDLPQCDATRTAARLAGLTSSPLLQEPVAAAMAYGFENTSDGEMWLVYDLGGGTFDAAVIQLRDGLFRVVNHGGDRHLGGKLLDGAIVNELLVPALLREHPLEEFHRGNPRWRAAFAKLKMAAETAKIRLSREPVVEVAIDPLCVDDRGERVAFEFDLEREAVEALLTPLALRTVNICKRVLAEKNLQPGDISKVLLVGGPTLMPGLRQFLSDPGRGLGIPLEFGIDPMTIVAKGAALFASSQRLEGPEAADQPEGSFALQLEYQPVGTDPEPLVGGKVLADRGQDFTGFTIEFVGAEAHPPRRSGSISLGAKGVFMTNLWAERGRASTYLIELRDPGGKQVVTNPDRFTYTFGAVPTDPPLIHSLGVANANNETDVFLRKGTPLPARKRMLQRTAILMRKGQAEDILRIPVVEGENVRRADRNRLIGVLEIRADQFQRDLPALSEIEITIEIDASRLFHARAYIPLLDREYSDVIHLSVGRPDLGRLREEIDNEGRRLAKYRRQVEDLEDAASSRILRRLDEEQILKDLESTLEAARGDPDAADKCQSRLLDLKSGIDEVEHTLEVPALLDKARNELAELKSLVDQHGTSDEKQQAEVLDGELAQATTARDPELLWRVSKDIRQLAGHLMWQQPSYLIRVLYVLDGLRGSMRDQTQAGKLFEGAALARQKNDLPALRSALQQLLGLLPAEKRGLVPGHGGSTYGI
jgi:molecular chaperone DnaK